MTTNNPEPTTDELIGDILMTTYEVRLMTEYEAESPTDAVDLFIRMVARRGFDDFIYRVRDIKTGEVWFVRDDELLTLDELLEAIDDEDDEDEDEDENVVDGL
jgi:hypothetical protein